MDLASQLVRGCRKRRKNNELFPSRILSKGGAALCVLTLTAEYADPFLRAYVMSTIWLAAAIANISLPGFAYAIVNKESLLAVISLPFLVSLLIWR